MSLRTQHSPTIVADAGGFTIAVSLSTQSGLSGTLSIGIGAAENIIISTTKAEMGATSWIVPARDIVIEADSSAAISALTMGGAGAASLTNGTAFTISGAGAGSRNEITSVITAQVEDDSNTTYQARTLTVQAEDHSRIVANSGAIALLFVLPSETNINVSVGISLAINSITSSTLANVVGARWQPPVIC